MLLEQQSLDELELFIKNVNESIGNVDSDCTVMDKISMDNSSIRLLRILTQVKKNDISKMLEYTEKESVPSNTEQLNNQEIQLFSKECVLKIFSSLSQEELIKQYSLRELEQMYVSVMDSKPLSKGKTKKGIVNSIYRYMHAMKRTQDFF